MAQLRSGHAVWLVAARAEAMRPFLSSNATSQMEGKPHGVFQDDRAGGGSEDEGGALCYSLGVEEIGGCDDVLEK